MNFQKEIPFVKPPKKYRGMLVIETDDGNVGDYTHWYPLLKSKTQQKSQWFPFNYTVAGSMAIPSQAVGQPGRMSKSQIQEMVDHGWEVMNHGRTEAGLAIYRTQEAVSVGDTRIRVSPPIAFKTNYEYILRQGDSGPQEVIKAKESLGEGVYELEEPLKNSYVENAIVELTSEALDFEINGGLDELIGMGFDVNHYVNPNHYWHHWATEKIKERHLTSRTRDGSVTTNTLPIPDLFKLIGNQDGVFKESEIKPLIDKIYEEDSIGIWYGHAFEYKKGSKLDKLLDYAIEKGVKIATRNEAYENKMI